MKTFYIHINNHKLYNKSKFIKFSYINVKKINQTPSYTVAATYDYDKGQFRFGIAKCSPKDQFVKKIGRIKAEGRAHSENAIIVNTLVGGITENKLGHFFINKALELVKSID